MTSPANLYRSLFSQSVAKIGYANRTSREVLVFLDQMAIDIEDQIKAASTDWSKRRLEQMLGEVRVITRSVRDKMFTHVSEEARVIAEAEARMVVKGLKQIAPIAATASLSVSKLKAIVETTPFDGRIMKDWFAGWEQSTFEAMKQQVWLGYAEGESAAQIAKRLIGTVPDDLLLGKSAPGRKGKGGTPRRYRGIMVASRRNARTIARTAIVHATNQARMEVYRANDDVISMVEWDATLDHATCSVCGSLDGRVFSLKFTNRVPPAHPNCRCAILPVVKKEFLPDDLPAGEKASIEGPIDARTTYEDWLRTQSHENVSKVLGKQKAKLFLDGKLKMERFIDNQDFELTLDELKAFNPAEWRLAFGTKNNPIIPSDFEREDLLSNAIDLWETVDDIQGADLIETLQEWQSPRFQDINEYMRAKAAGETAFQKFVEELEVHAVLEELHAYALILEEAFEAGLAHQIEKPMMVFRGVLGKVEQTLTAMRVGDTFMDAGFLATTIDREVALGFAEKMGGVVSMLEIELPTGTRVLPLNAKSPRSGLALLDEWEKEILLQNEAQLQLTQIRHDKIESNGIMTDAVIYVFKLLNP